MQAAKAWPAVAVAVLAVAVADGFSASSSKSKTQTASHAAKREAARRREGKRLVRLIAAKHEETARWRRLMGRHPLAHGDLGTQSLSLGYRRWVLRLWATRASSARRSALHPPHLAAWQCIQRYEASWRDPDPPYYGGLQMDLDFQRTYGPALLRRKGTADHWTPLEQMWVAERAYESGRGFYPWPNTAHWCGLL
jgi:hypothetical protein